MTPAPSEQSVFAEALLRDTPEARRALLRAAENAGGFLEEPPTGLSSKTGSTVQVGELSEKAGDKIGRYKLLQQIGEGGCGVVYMAEQLEPVKRRVALKVIKLGMDTKSVIARFEAERQALALMDHPNIAKVLDAGATETGRPYFVMELVRGIRITDYCDQNNLSTEERLKLFVQVCLAIQHAHQKGIIHRDIKPSNILVTQDEKEPVPKVIDFGIAKATSDQPLTDKTVFTAFEQFIGTPAYMSPEQAMMTNLDIDTRTDIYALGVLLYELLTGTTPFDAKDLMAVGLDAMRRTIREQEPPKPSTRLTQELVAADVRRRTGAVEPDASSPRRLQDSIRLLRGDLDWIVMKAIEKDRTRRYETASSFAADVEHYLNDELVQARPPSTSYRLRKFARRNQVALLTASLVFAALLAGIVIATWQAVIATRAKAAAVAEQQRANQEAATAKRVTESFQQMLGLIDPDAASRSMLSLSAVRLQVMLGLVSPTADRGTNYSLLQLIDDFADNLEGKLADEPAAAADLHATIGRAYACRGERAKAQKHLDRALELGRQVYGEQHEKYADILVDHARPDGSDPSTRRAREADLRRALAIYRARGIAGEQVIRALFTLQWNLGEQASGGAPAKRDEIEPVLNEALAEAAKTPSIEFPKIASIYAALSGVRIRQARLVEAEQLARKALVLHLKSHPESLETGWGYAALGTALKHQGKFAEALVAEKQAFAIMRAALPPENASIAYVLSFLIDTLTKADVAHALPSMFPSVAEVGELEAMFREVLTTTRPSTVRYDDPTFVAARGMARLSIICMSLGNEWAAMGKTQEAEESKKLATLITAGYPEQTRKLYRNLLSQTGSRASELQNGAAWLLATAEVPAERDPALAVELAAKAVGSASDVGAFRNTLGVARYRAGDWQQAIADLNQSVALSNGGDSYDFLFLAMAHWQLGDDNEARRWHERAVAAMSKQPPSEELRRFRAEADELMKQRSGNQDSKTESGKE